jgi:hypothetical protein
MKFLIYFVLGFVVLSSSCARKTLVRKSTEPASIIKEVEEKIVPNEDGITNKHQYFVIIGSFRNPENSKKYQELIEKEGFRSEILRNEDGLYRVSVIATDEISIARDEVRRIWKSYPKYHDTWLLIKKK